MADIPHIMVVEARFYEDIADELVRGALSELEKAGVTYERFSVPGAFEIPAAIQYAVRSMHFFAGRKRFDGYVALGCVIRGETYHFEIVSNESSRGLMDLGVQRGLCIGNGILTVENERQALERASPEDGDKGGDAARACLALINTRTRFGVHR